MKPSSGASRLFWLPASLITLAAAAGWGVFLSGGLRSIVGWLALLTIVPVFALLVFLVTAIRALRRPRRPAALAVTAVAFVAAAWPAAWNFQLLTIAYPYSLATASPAASVRLPLDGPVRVAWGGDDTTHNHHAAFPDQRWAYDLAVEPAFTHSSKLADYGCWGKDVLAPARAEVWRVHDGEPDATPGELAPNLASPLGNSVALRLSTGTFLLIAHLQKGSVAAREGERVAEGEVLGRCGNSGNTSEPHVHIHHQRQDPRLYPVNFAEGLPLYFRDHDGAPMPEGGLSLSDGVVTPTGAIVRHLGSVADSQ